MSKERTPRILLVNPWIHDFAAFDCWSKPLGLLYIASVLRAEGFSVELVDCLSTGCPSTVAALRRRPNGSGHFLKEQLPKPAPLGHVPRKYSRYGIPPEHFRR